MSDIQVKTSTQQIEVVTQKKTIKISMPLSAIWLFGKITWPLSSTDNAIVRFDWITGRLVQNSWVYIDDSGNLGIGISIPEWLLHSFWNTSQALWVFSANANFPLVIRAQWNAWVTSNTSAYRMWLEFWVGWTQNGYIDFWRGSTWWNWYLRFWTSWTDRLSIDASWNVWIWTVSPTNRLHIVYPDWAMTNSVLTRWIVQEFYWSTQYWWKSWVVIIARWTKASPTSCIATDTHNTPTPLFYDGTKYRIGGFMETKVSAVVASTSVSTDLIFYTWTVSWDASTGTSTWLTEQMRILSSWNVWISSTAPTTKLQIFSQTATWLADPSAISLWATYWTGTVGKNMKLKIYDDGTTSWICGIGISAGLMEIKVGSSASLAIYKDHATVPVELFRITNAWNVWIGKSNPLSKLSVVWLPTSCMK